MNEFLLIMTLVGKSWLEEVQMKFNSNCYLYCIDKTKQTCI